MVTSKLILGYLVESAYNTPFFSSQFRVLLLICLSIFSGLHRRLLLQRAAITFIPRLQIVLAMELLTEEEVRSLLLLLVSRMLSVLLFVVVRVISFCLAIRVRYMAVLGGTVA